MKRDFDVSNLPPAAENDGVDTIERLSTRPIGEIIRHFRLLSDTDIDHIVAVQRDRGLRFGEAAVALALVSQADVLWALAQQFHYPYPMESLGPPNAELVVASDPYSDQAEAFRDLRSRLMAAQETRGKPIAVLSPDAGDGRTFVAANLAVAFSQVGERTVLIDANLRSPRLHRLFDIDERAGLTDLLAGRHVARPLEQIAGLPTLHVMQVGTPPPNPVELLQRRPFALLLQELRVKFDRVIVDTPPARTRADARVIAAACGQAIVVARKNSARHTDLKRVAASLQRNRVDFVGVVVSNI